MNRTDRGPLLLILAGILLVLAVIAYLVSAAEENFRRREATMHGREALRVQAERSIRELRASQEENVRIGKERADLRIQYEEIHRSLGRIEKRLEALARAGRSL